MSTKTNNRPPLDEREFDESLKDAAGIVYGVSNAPVN